MDADKIIIEPLLTEKSNRIRENHKYAFRVDPKANKIEIRNAIEELFNVHPISCTVSNVKRKPKRAPSKCPKTQLLSTYWKGALKRNMIRQKEWLKMYFTDMWCIFPGQQLNPQVFQQCL